MRETVPPEVAVPPEDLTAGRAVVGLYVGVGQEVGLEIGALVEGAAADGALVGRLLHVQYPVDDEGPRLAEALAALQALERLLLAVDVPARRSR